MRTPSTGPTRIIDLRRRSRTPAWASLTLRVVAVIVLIGIALGGHWFDREGLRDNIDGHISFVDVLYFTTITVTTVGYGDITPVTDQARLFDALVVTPIRLFVWLIFLGTAYDFLLTGVWRRWRMRMIERGLKNHVVMVGYGVTGVEAVGELIRRGVDPHMIVVVDGDEARTRQAEACGVNVLTGDATRDQVLETAQVGRAASVVVATGRDDTSILVVLTARRLAPVVPISIVVRSEDNEAIARQAGASTVINPASLAGLLLAGSTQGEHIADYLADLAACDGEVHLQERPVTAAEVGRSLNEVTPGLGVRIQRGGRAYGYWRDEARKLEAGDVLVEIVPNKAVVPQ
ncbi:MAG TPA: NAD-binding protein [Sphingomonas sp.]|jgi:voltage-gated potassium channel|uniref:potassium channel family protein n=1 Tax=Sphingomonas sp. TaxID=28214 RepID=UPI002EDB4EAA